MIEFKNKIHSQNVKPVAYQLKPVMVPVNYHSFLTFFTETLLPISVMDRYVQSRLQNLFLEIEVN
jgi:hypothetical protein